MKNHDRRAIPHSAATESIAQGAVHMRVAKAIAANQDRAGFIDMPYQRDVRRTEWFDQKLVELEAAGD